MLKDIDLTNKCGSCCHFMPIEDTATGECLQNPYDDSVVHDPKHPHWIVQRSRIKCKLYNANPQTNADRIRSMSDEKLAKFLTTIADGDVYSIFCDNPKRTVVCSGKCKQCIVEWLKQPADDWYCTDGERRTDDAAD